MTTTQQGDFFPACLIHADDTYVDDETPFRVVSTIRDGWFVTIGRDDGTTKRYFMSYPLEVLDLAS